MAERWAINNVLAVHSLRYTALVGKVRRHFDFFTFVGQNPVGICLDLNASLLKDLADSALFKVLPLVDMTTRQDPSTWESAHIF